VVSWPAPPGGSDGGAYAVRIGGLPSPQAEEAARRAGLWIDRRRSDAVLRGTASSFAAFGGEGEVGAAAAAALDRFRHPPRALEACGRTFSLERPLIVGILNATPDSFYDRGRYFSLPEALARADEMVGEGADLIEVGGETARPGPPVDADEECRRVVPLIEALAARLAVPVSVDTYKPEVAARAVGAGAVMINDISGLADVRVAEVAAQRGAALVVMHILGRPKVRQLSPQYGEVVDEVYTFLEAQTDAARAAGVPRARVVVDPGFSFGKAPQHDVEILRRFGEFRGLGYPLYLATSRKNYIRDLLALPFEELLEGTAAAVAYGLAQGAHFVRTHDVRFMARLARMMHAVLHLGEGSGAPERPAVEVTKRGQG